MTLKQRIEQDLKTAMLSGDKGLATTLKGIKNAVLYAEVSSGKREEGLSDKAALEVLSKEAKKRQESAVLYEKGGNKERYEAEIEEKRIIEGYLPKQLNEENLKIVIDGVISDLKADDPKDMGRVISEVKNRTMGRADGAAIARLVKEKL